MRTWQLILINLGVTTLLIFFLTPLVINNVTSDPDGQAISQRLESANSSELISDEPVVDLVAEANPAVLSIIVSEDVPIIERYLAPGPFGLLFPRERSQGTTEQQVGSGSGFIVSDSGLVVTNRHVASIVGADYVGVDATGREYELSVIDRDPILDIAILQIENPDNSLPTLIFGNSEDLKLGQTVVAIGNALGEFSNSVSVGVVSGLSRSIVAGSRMGESELLENVIQTDAAINPGNSGGPLLNLTGEVVGVNVAVASGSENIGFALPSNVVENIVRSVKDTGEITRPYLGVRYLEVNEQVANSLDLEAESGALIYSQGETAAVDPVSPAARAGLQEGDIITAIDDKSITNDYSLAIALRQYQPGDSVKIAYQRNGEVNEVVLELVPFDTQ